MMESKDPSQQNAAETNEVLLQARTKMMDYLARRDHSERELRQKLFGKFEPAVIEAALDFAREKGWLPSDADSNLKLSQKFAEDLHRRHKGIQFINQVLREKGLPQLSADSALELEKARLVLETKYSRQSSWDAPARSKAIRFLASRGFEMDVIMNVVPKR